MHISDIKALPSSFRGSQQMHPISEIALIGLSLISTTATSLMLADAPPAQAFALQWLLLPLLGALCASVVAMLLNPHPEARKVVLGRGILGVVFGTGLPKVATMVHPAIREWSLDPAFAFLAGFSICLLAYVCARPFVEKLFARSGHFVDAGLDEAERRIVKMGPPLKSGPPKGQQNIDSGARPR